VESWPSTANDEVALEQQQDGDAPVAGEVPTAAAGSAAVAAGGGSLAGPALEGSSRGAATAGITDQLLPPPALSPQAAVSPGAAKALLCATDAGTPGATGESGGGVGICGKLVSPQEGAGLCSPQQQQPKGAARRSPGPGSGSKERMLGGTAHLQGTSPTASGRGSYMSAQPRGAAILTSHLTKEVESLRDELLIKTELADALECKVGMRGSVVGKPMCCIPCLGMHSGTPCE